MNWTISVFKEFIIKVSETTIEPYTKKQGYTRQIIQGF